MQTVQDFFDQTQIAGALTPEQAAQLLELGPQGDTAFPAEPAATPAAAPAPEPKPEPAATGEKHENSDPNATPADPDPDKTAILAKDGKHLIEYQKLVDAREGEQAAKAQAEQLAAQLAEAERINAELKAQVAKPATTEPPATPAPPAVDLKTLRMERIAALASGNDARALELDEKIEAEVVRLAEERTIQRLAQQQAQDAAAAQMTEMQRIAAEAKAKYPALDPKSGQANEDAIDFVVVKRDALIQRGELPHKALETAVAQAAKLFKWTDGQPAPAADPKSAEAAAKAAIAAAKAPVPASLSDIPGGRTDGTTPEQRLAQMSAPDMLEAMQQQRMTPEQIESFLNRTL